MNNPGHEQPFNKTAEEADREEHPLRGLMNVSREWQDVKEQEEALAAEQESGKKIELVVAGGVTATKKDIQKLLPAESPAPAEGSTYREELETNDDGTPNVNFSKE